MNNWKRSVISLLLAVTMAVSTAAAAEQSLEDTEPAASASSAPVEEGLEAVEEAGDESVEEEATEPEPLPEIPATPEVVNPVELPEDMLPSAETYEQDYCAANGHGELVDWMGNGNGTMTATCTNCGAQVTEPCEMTETVIAPTCLASGWTQHLCTVCGYNYVDTLTEALGHSYIVTTASNGRKMAVCERCGESFAQNPDDLSAVYSDGRTFSAKLVSKLTAYLAEKDTAFNEQATALVSQHKSDVDDVLYMVNTNADTEEEQPKNTLADATGSYNPVDTDTEAVITWLETEAYMDADMNLSYNALKKRIDAVYAGLYHVSVEKKTLPNASAYSSQSDYAEDLSNALTGSGSTLRQRVISLAYNNEGSRDGHKFVRYVNSIRSHNTSLSDPWCTQFAIYCVRKSGASGSVCPAVTSSESGVSAFRGIGKLHRRGSGYTPKAGDIVFFTRNGSDPYHTGVVVSCSGGTLHTIEGNSGGKVRTRSYSSGTSHIYAYGEVEYDKDTLLVSVQKGDIAEACKNQIDSKKTRKVYKSMMA